MITLTKVARKYRQPTLQQVFLWPDTNASIKTQSRHQVNYRCREVPKVLTQLQRGCSRQDEGREILSTVIIWECQFICQSKSRVFPFFICQNRKKKKNQQQANTLITLKPLTRLGLVTKITWWKINVIFEVSQQHLSNSKNCI